MKIPKTQRQIPKKIPRRRQIPKKIPKKIPKNHYILSMIYYMKALQGRPHGLIIPF
jgi:hypothetical protein